MLFSAILVLLLFTGITASPSPPTSHASYNAAIYEAAYATDSQTWLSNISTDPFYNSPIDAASYLPGDVMRLEKVSGEQLKQYTIPLGLSLYRMLYQSADMDDRPVPASAFILLPYSRPQSGEPLKVIVWTHGTAGIDRQCAPSNRHDLYYDYDGPYAMALRGYAVIAPDYAGLGTNTTFHYMAGPSHALDVAFAVVAARRNLPPGLIGQDWVVVGHSEGGMTAWITNELQVTQPIGGFRGSVAIAPALQNIHILRYGMEHDNVGESLFYSPYTLHAIARMYESVDVSDYLTDLGMERTRLARTGCYHTASTLFANLTYSDVIKDKSWLDSTWAAEWETRTSVSGEKPLAQPLLLVQAQADRAVFPAITEAVFSRHCTSQPNTRAHLSRYPDLDHDGVNYVAQLEYFDWIADRFNGVEVEGCSNSTVDTIQINTNRLVIQA
ncbi:putative secretory lipase [Hysterangium stoloniferum]|nr:putative secretory lipase [Hysterangium stoloniferum]